MAQDFPNVADQFTERINRIIEFPKTAGFGDANLLLLLGDLFDFSILVSPRRDTIATLRERIGKHTSHDEMENFAFGLEKYMERLHPDFYLNHVANTEEAASSSVNMMNISMAIRFVVMEYVTWDEVNQVNEQGKAILLATAARFVSVLKTLRLMRSDVTDPENRDELRQVVAGSPDRVELLERVLAEAIYDEVEETLIQDFFNKHAREDIWRKVFDITNENDFLDRNPGGNKCCYCLIPRLDHGNNFVMLNICWDLYCLDCVRRISFATEGRCVRLGCNLQAAAYLSAETYRKFREEINKNVLGPFQKHFLEPMDDK